MANFAGTGELFHSRLLQQTRDGWRYVCYFQATSLTETSIALGDTFTGGLTSTNMLVDPYAVQVDFDPHFTVIDKLIVAIFEAKRAH